MGVGAAVGARLRIRGRKVLILRKKKIRIRVLTKEGER